MFNLLIQFIYNIIDPNIVSKTVKIKCFINYREK